MASPRNILILTYWDYHDALIQTYTLPYVKIISNILSPSDHIYLVTLNKKTLSTPVSLPGISQVAFHYIPFGIKAILYYGQMLVSLLLLIYRRKITHIHVWCTPAGVFGYILSILTRRPLIIDSYEPHAEAMTEVGQWKKGSLAFRLLFWFEKKMTHHAQYLIATTEGMIKEYAVTRYQYNPDKNNWYVKPACVDLTLFCPDKEKRQHIRKQLHIEDKIVGIYAGKLGGIYLEEEVFQWLKIAHEYWQDKFVFIMLSAYPASYLHNQCKKYGIPLHTIISLFVPHTEVASYLNAADFAITPVKPVYTKKFCTPIKNGEYWAVGLPVIIPNDISVDADIIKEHHIGYVLKDLSYAEMKQSVITIEKIIAAEHKHKIRNIAERHRNFNIASDIYHKIYQK